MLELILNQLYFSHKCKAVGSGKPSCKNCGGILCRFRIRPTSIQLTAINMFKLKSTYEEGWSN